MKTITKSVIKLSEIPENLQKDQVFIGHKIHTYAEFHIDDLEQDELTLWLINEYPELKRKVSFLIHIDKEAKQNRSYSEEEVDNLCELIKQNERQWDLFDKNIVKIKPKSYYEAIEQFKNN